MRVGAYEQAPVQRICRSCQPMKPCVPKLCPWHLHESTHSPSSRGVCVLPMHPTRWGGRTSCCMRMIHPRQTILQSCVMRVHARSPEGGRGLSFSFSSSQFSFSLLFGLQLGVL